MKTKIIKGMLVLFGAAALLTGCSTTANQGAMGNDTQYGAGAGGGGANGSVSQTNPFGLETGSGISR